MALALLNRFMTGADAMNRKMDDSAGAGYARLLSLTGVPRPAQLLDICRRRSGRKALAERSGVAEPLLLQWARMVDLPASGRGGFYVELLQMAEVDEFTRVQLRNSEAAAGDIAGAGVKVK